MKLNFRSLLRAAVGLGIAAALGVASVSAQTPRAVSIFGVTSDNQLVSFASTAPGTLTSTIGISGLPEGDRIVGIDFRPATGQLLAITSASRLYTLNTTTGGLTNIGGAFSTLLSGNTFGFDFNPTVDRIRLTSDSGQNLRLNPNNGAVAFIDGTLSYNTRDTNTGAAPNIVASAYTNSFATTTTTTLYNIDASLDILVTQNPPNAGVLNTIGALGIDAGSNTSFDIGQDSLGSDNAFLVINGTLYTVNLSTGAASSAGSIGAAVTSIAVSGSRAAAAPATACADFSGSTTPIVRAEFAGVVGYCRVLYENGNASFALAGAQLGSQAVLDRGVIQAVDVFTGTAATSLGGAAQICLQGTGTLFFLNAAQSPRTPVILTSTSADGYTCGFITTAGTLALTRN